MIARSKPPLLRPLHRPRRWLAGWCLLIVMTMAASLLPVSELPPPRFFGIDKLKHFFAYALLSGYAVMLFARMRAQALVALGLIVFGIGLEVAQAGLTQTRLADPADAFANTLGVLAGLLLGATPAAGWLQRLDARLP